MSNYLEPLMESKYAKKPQETSNLKSGANIAKVVLGNSLMYNPSIFYANGIKGGVLLFFLLGGVFSHISLYLLFKLSLELNERKYEDLIARTLGKWLKTTIKLFVLSLCAFSIFTYVEMTVAILKSFGLDNVKAFYFTMGSFIVTNLVFTEYSQLFFVNAIGLFAVGFFALLAGLKCFQNWSIDKVEFHKTSENLVITISRISLTFCYHYCVLPFTDSLKSDDDSIRRKNMIYATSYAAAISTAVHMFVGITGYIAYPTDKKLWFENVPSSDFFVFFSLLVTLFVITLLSVPICFIGVMIEIEPLLPQAFLRSSRFAVNVIITVLMVVVGRQAAANNICAGLVNIFTTFVMFLFPALAFLRTFTKTRFEKVFAVICVFFGLGLLGVSFYDLGKNIYQAFMSQ